MFQVHKRALLAHFMRFFLVVLLSSGTAQAFPSIYDEWNLTYPDSTIDDDLVAATGAPCQVCHVNSFGGEPWNQYGYSVLSNGGLGNIPGAFFAVEDLDADGEGSSNLDEINAGTTPGWCDESNPGCENLAWTRAGVPSPATPPAGVPLDPPPGAVPPVAEPGGPYGGIVGVQISFDGTGSSDPDGDIIAWDWDFGDGNGAAGSVVGHVYAAPGTYTVTLTVTDSAALSASASTTATIQPDDPMLPPVADPGGPYSGTEGTAIFFDGSQSFDQDGNLVAWDWDFGDGVGAAGESVSHIYTTAGNYTVTLTVTDSDGLSDSGTASVSVTPLMSDGETIYRSICQNCHGDPWDGPAVDPGLVAGRRNTGARLCSIEGAIFGNLVFPGGVPEMQFLQGMFSSAELQSVSDFLNSRLPVEGQRRYVTTCAGCHGANAFGGRVDKDIRGERPRDVWRALHEEAPMAYLQCIPPLPDVIQIGRHLQSLDNRR